VRPLLGLLVLAIVGHAGAAIAYPQFQLSRDQTCFACHLSPAGGGLLNENGLATADSISRFGTAPEFMYGAIPQPSWLALGGDLRGASGFDSWPTHELATFPMEADLYAAITVSSFSLHVTGGLRDPQYGDTLGTIFYSPEHWLQWELDPGESRGLVVRAGRFAPVYGLRYVEHTAFDDQYGGNPLYGEAYGVAIEYVDPKWEVHLTGFLHDPWQYSSELGNGAALYAEARPTKTTSVGVESKLEYTPDARNLYSGITAKQLVGPVLFELEAEVENQRIDLGGHDDQLVQTLLASWFIGGFMIDLGVGAWEPNLHVRYLDQEAADLNIHYFLTSHVELLLINRFQMLELGEGGVSSGYSLLQLHYRL
jgi:hypothetical protein